MVVRAKELAVEECIATLSSRCLINKAIFQIRIAYFVERFTAHLKFVPLIRHVIA